MKKLTQIRRQLSKARSILSLLDSPFPDAQELRQRAQQTELIRSLEAQLVQRNIRKEKIAKLAEVSATCGVKDLEFTEDGAFRYQRTDAGMLSTSQLMRLSSELSALYPEGLGVELLDRGESLGKSIFDFVRKAEDEKSTILAAIVGEAPAKVPENIGVFVVDSGKVIAK